MLRGRCVSARSPFHRGARIAPSIAGLCIAGAVQAQGLYAGDSATDGHKLPGDFEPVLQLRTYYFDQESTSGAPSTAWAAGGWAGLRSPWFGGLIQAGVVGYASWKLYGPAGEGGTRILTASQTSITALGEAFGALRLAGQTITAYRQLINRPFVNPQDNRMIPNTFEAYTVTGAVQDLSYIGGFITKEKTRDTDSFRWMSAVAGGSGSGEGVAFGGATYTFLKTGYVRVDEQYAIDAFNTFYADVRYPIALDGGATLALGAQYYPQSSVGDERLGSFSTWGYGLQAAFAWRALGVQFDWTQTGKARDTLNPFGTHPSYLDLMQVSFNTAGEKAWGIGGNIDFAGLGLPGLTASAIYADGHDRIDYTTGAPLRNRSETNLRADYAFPKDSLLDGLIATLRYSWLRQDGAAQTGTQLRAYLNYAMKF